MNRRVSAALLATLGSRIGGKKKLRADLFCSTGPSSLLHVIEGYTSDPWLGERVCGGVVLALNLAAAPVILS